MRKSLAWRVYGLVAGLLGFMILGSLATMLIFHVKATTSAVGFAAAAASTLIITAVCLLISATLLDGNDRAAVRAEHAEIKAQLSETTKQLADLVIAVDLLRGAVEKRGGDVAVISRTVRAISKRVGAAERQLHAARNAELVLTRAQRHVDERSAELGGNVHHIR